MTDRALESLFDNIYKTSYDRFETLDISDNDISLDLYDNLKLCVNSGLLSFINEFIASKNPIGNGIGRVFQSIKLFNIPFCEIIKLESIFFYLL